MDKSSSETLPPNHSTADFDRTRDSLTNERMMLTEQMIAERLSAALANAGIDQLDQGRHAFVDRRLPKPNFEPVTQPPIYPETEADRLLKEAEALKAAERELELRRA